MAVNAIVKFLNAARSLVNQGMSKEAVMNFAKNEFGEINELFKKQIDNLFKPKQGIENIKLKDEVFDDTVVKMQFDDSGVPFNPKDPIQNPAHLLHRNNFPIHKGSLSTTLYFTD